MNQRPLNPASHRRRWLPQWVRTLAGSVLVIAGVLGVLAGIAYAKTRQIQAAMSVPPPPEMPTSVSISVAQPTVFRQSTVVVGTVLAPKSIVLQTELTGLVTEVLVQPGDTVEKGELLVQLDDRSEQALLESAQASRRLAQSVLKRMQRLAQARAGTESDLDVAEAELIRSSAAVDELEVRIDRKKLKAPFDARVGLFDLHEGQYLVEGSRITTLEGIADYLHVDFAMPAHVADAVAVGDEVEIRISESSPLLPGKIIAFDAAADAVSRSVMARAKIFDPPAILNSNDSVRVKVSYGEPIDACLIPSTAVRRGPAGTVVYVAAQTEGTPEIAPSLRAQSRDVMIGGSTGSMTRIIGGITAGERVVADGSFKVFEGSLLADIQAPQS